MTRRRRLSLDENELDYELDPDNDVMKFLIVLTEADFKAKCWPFKRYSTHVKQSGTYLSGELDIVSIKNISQRDKKGKKKYNINEMTNLKTLYIKIPKEQLYVKSNVWQFEYMKSQIREIIHIFGLLGARSVEYKVLSSNLNSFNFSSDVGVERIPIESGIKISNKDNLSTEISGKITYEAPIKFPSSKIICESDNIYYIIRKDDWKDICERRILNKATQDNFTFKFNTDISFSFKVTEKLKNLGIIFDVNSEETKNFTMQFSVDYYKEEDIIDAHQVWETRSVHKHHLWDNKSAQSDPLDHEHFVRKRKNSCNSINSISSDETYYHSDDEYCNKKNPNRSSFAIKKLNYASSSMTPSPELCKLKDDRIQVDMSHIELNYQLNNNIINKTKEVKIKEKVNEKVEEKVEEKIE